MQRLNDEGFTVDVLARTNKSLKKTTVSSSRISTSAWLKYYSCGRQIAFYSSEG